jgi:hypothetical protein
VVLGAIIVQNAAFIDSVLCLWTMILPDVMRALANEFRIGQEMALKGSA